MEPHFDDLLLAEIKLAYGRLNLVPSRRCFFLRENGVDHACPVVCLLVNRGLTDKDDPALAKDDAGNVALEWAAQTFGEDFIWGLISAWDGQEMVKEDADFVRGYALGLEAAEHWCPREP